MLHLIFQSLRLKLWEPIISLYIKKFLLNSPKGKCSLLVFNPIFMYKVIKKKLVLYKIKSENFSKTFNQRWRCMNINHLN